MAKRTSFQGVRYSFENSDPVRMSRSTKGTAVGGGLETGLTRHDCADVDEGRRVQQRVDDCPRRSTVRRRNTSHAKALWKKSSPSWNVSSSDASMR